MWPDSPPTLSFTSCSPRLPRTWRKVYYAVLLAPFAGMMDGWCVYSVGYMRFGKDEEYSAAIGIVIFGSSL